RGVAGDVQDDERAVRAGGVELGAGREAALAQAVRREAPRAQPAVAVVAFLAGGGCAGRDAREQRVERGAERGAAVEVAREEAREQEVVVGVDEAGRERAAAEIDRARGGEGSELGGAPDRGDAAA